MEIVEDNYGQLESVICNIFVGQQKSRRGDSMEIGVLWSVISNTISNTISCGGDAARDGIGDCIGDDTPQGVSIVHLRKVSILGLLLTSRSDLQYNLASIDIPKEF